MNYHQHPTPSRDDASLLPSSLLKTDTAPGTSPGRGIAGSKESGSNFDHVPALPLRYRIFQIPGFGRLRTISDGKKSFVSVDDAAKIGGLTFWDITGRAERDADVWAKMPSYRNPPTIHRFKVDGMVLDFVDGETLLPIFKHARGGAHLIRFLLQRVLPPVPEGRPVGPAEEIPACRFTTAAGQFVVHVFYKRCAGEIRAIVTGGTVFLSVDSVARVMRIPESTVVRLAGPGNSLTIPGKLLHAPVAPKSRNVFIRSCNAIPILKAGQWLDADDVEEWIQDELMSPSKLIEAGAVVSLRGLHQALAPTAGFYGWRADLVMKSRSKPCCYEISPMADSIPVTVAGEFARSLRNYAGSVVWLLLRDGGAFRGGRVGETADEALVRISQVFPNERGLVPAPALHKFLRTKSSFKLWFERNVEQPVHNSAHNNHALGPGGPFLSIEVAYVAIVWSIGSAADFRTTLIAPSKP